MDGSRGAVAVAILVVLVASASAPAGGAAGAPSTDRTVTRIALAENGTATWQVGVWTRLPTDDSVADYERFQDRFRENTSAYLDPFRRNIDGVVADAAAETDREMRATDFEASTRVQALPRRWGIVTYRFEWTNFAATDGTALVVGDVFRGDFYLTANDTLALVGPADYEAATVAPEPAERERNRVRWFGRRTFADDRPRVRFEPRPTPSPSDRPTAATDTPAASPASGVGETGAIGTAGTDTGSDRDGGGPPTALLGVATAVVVVLGAGTYRYFASRTEGEPSPTGPGGDAVTADGAASASATPASVAEPDSGTADGVSDPDGDTEPEASPEPMLTDEDRVRRLLEDSDGRLRQSDIVDRLDWSKSKTSRVLSTMAEEETVEKLRIGRENVISLADEEVPDGGDDESTET